MQQTPKITVLMPVYNVAPYVREAIESILNQTCRDFELLIINDGSTDATRTEVLKFTDPRIRFVENETNIGLANTLNKGIDLARGEYIARMDGDDISLPYRLEKQAAILDDHPEIDICGAGYRFFGTKNFDVLYPSDHQSIQIGLLFGCCMIIPLFRKKSIENTRLRYEQDFFPAEDYRFWTRCVMRLNLYNIPEVLFLYRMHPMQVSETMKNQPQMAEHVKLLYFQCFFSQFSDDEVSDFISVFAGKAPITRFVDIQYYDAWVNRLLKANKTQRAVKQKVLKAELHRHIERKLRNFVVDIWFAKRYSVRRFLQLVFSGIYFRLSSKFRIKLLLKSLMRKKRKKK